MTTDHDQQTFSRRNFIKGGAGLTFVILVGGVGCKRKVKPEGASTSSKEQAAASNDPATVGAWVVIDPDGSIVIHNPAAEMGQGSMTALPLILAEEMDADWERVHIEHSPVDVEVYGRSWGRSGPATTMLTVGSRSVPGYFSRLRIAGGRIRRALLDNAARIWEVPVDELTTEPSMVVHEKSGRRISYGDLAAQGKVPSELPEISESDLKSPDEFRLIGMSVPRADVPEKTDGSAEFALDLHLPNMLYGVVERSPIHNGSPKSYNVDAVRALGGVATTVELDHGVGIIGESVEAVFAARNKLKVEWNAGSVDADFDSQEALSGYPKVAEDEEFDAQKIVEEGDASAALKKSKKRYRADFYGDHVCHAQMEPLNAVVSVKDDGSAEVWVGTQGPGIAKSAVAEAVGIDEDRVTMHRTYLGGGFGRRSSPDFVVEAAELSAAVKKPVKLIWTRPDDVRYGKFRPMCFQRLQAGVGEDGTLEAWTHCVVGAGGNLQTSGVKVPFYDIANQDVELREVDHGVRLHYWRSVGHPLNKFAIEAFVDEIAADQGVDPLEFRQRLLRKSPRALKVLETVAEMSDWGASEVDGRAKGLAFGERSDALAAGVAEISVDEESGEIRVHRFWAALDAGIIVQPDNASAQIEGSIVMGLSSALKESITLENGRVQQSNYTDYPLLRMSESPEIEVKFIDSQEYPAGIGEPGVPITGPAVANAFARLTGKHLRHMPFTPERVKAALG